MLYNWIKQEERWLQTRQTICRTLTIWSPTVNQFTTHRFHCGGASLDLSAYGGITAKDDSSSVELSGVSADTLRAAVLSYVYQHEWADRDSRQPDEFLEALIAKATEALRDRQARREQTSA